MSLREAIKAVIYQRLAVVAEEILAAAERVVAEYEKEDAFLKLRIEDQRRILELVLNADTGWWHLHLFMMKSDFQFWFRVRVGDLEVLLYY